MKRNFFIAGGQYHDLAKVVYKLRNGQTLDLQPEPDNKYDPNAVKILARIEDENIFLGYVPKRFSSEISMAIETGMDITCTILNLNPKAKTWEMCMVEIRSADEPEDVVEEESEGDVPF
jgi:hypothetical protein